MGHVKFLGKFIGFIFCSMLLIHLFWPCLAMSCTGIFLKNNHGYIFARSFDWPRVQGMVFVNNRNVTKTAMTSLLGESKSIQWTSRYGSVTICQVGCDLPNFGVNEAGLSVQGFIFSRASYPEKDTRPIIAQVQFKQFLLDNCSTVDDVIKICSTVRIQSPTNRFGQHYLACDSSGECVAIDFVEGKTIFHTGKNLPVTAYVDTAMYDECIDYLNKHKGFGGSKPVGGGNSALDRFVRASIGMQIDNPDVDDGFRILDEVKIEGYTQWQIVFDSKTHTLYYRTRLNSRIRKLNSSRFDYSCNQTILCTGMEVVEQGSILTSLVPYASAKHLLYLKELNQFYRLSEDMVVKLSKYPETFVCSE